MKRLDSILGQGDSVTKPVEPEDALIVVERALAGARKPDLPPSSALPADFDRDHLQLLTDKLSETAEDLRAANGRLRALINIGLELASEHNASRLLHSACVAARDLFGATYVTVGIVDRDARTLQQMVTDGTDAADWITNGDPITGILGTVIQQRRTVRGDNPARDPAAVQLPDRHPDVRGFLVAPVSSPAHVYGWMFLARNDGPPFTGEDEQLVMALAGQVGRIYENGYFYRITRSERDRAQRYLDTADVILLALDLEGRITLVNRYACSVLGWSAENLIGRDFFDTCVPLRIREEVRRTLRVGSGGDDAVVETAVLTSTGDERLIEWRTSVLRDEDGTIVSTLSSGIDVTERHHAEAQVRLQGAALNAAANAIAITDREGLIEWVNPAFSDLTGYTAAEAMGKNPRELVKSEQHDPGFYENLWRTILSGQVWRGEIINRRKDGSVYTEEQAITPVRDADGEIRHFIAVKQDITERQRAEAEFRQRAQLSALGAAIGLSLANTDALAEALPQCAEALVTHLDVACARIWTLNRRDGVLELAASAGLATHPETTRGPIRLGQSAIGRIARDRTPHVTNAAVGDPELNEQDWARREAIVAFAGHPLMDGGRVVGVMDLYARHALPEAVTSALASVAHHIAIGIERHRGADALRTAEERMRFALESAGVGIWDMDYTTGLLRWSDIMERQYGVPSGAFEGTFDAYLARIHPQDRDSVRDAVGKAMTSGSDFSVEHRTIWPDGTIRSMTGAGRVVLGENGAPVRAIGISLDVSERRILEAQYQQAQKMEAIGRLAGGVAHDFNNLLTAILGYCELLLEDIPEDSPQRADITEVQTAGKRAASLTRQLLTFSRRQIIEPTLLDLSVVASGMRAMLERLIGEDVEIVMRLEPQLASVKADRGQVEQILLNLAINARDAMPTGGTLLIETASVELDEHYATRHFAVAPGPYVLLAVTDTGTGMTPEVQSRLFEPFFTTKDVGKGTGLGLATVHGIVTRSGGTVTVYSESGRGTSFNVYLPRADAADLVVEAPVVLSRLHGGTQTVLVVEDADGLRELAKRLLERLGYTVLTAANADEALRLFEQHASIDVLLTDVVMPGASGPELTRELLEQWPGLKVVYMSGYTEDAIVHHGVLNAGIAFLHKPFTSDTLDRKLREVLDQ